jgi:hypothetical protein
MVCLDKRERKYLDAVERRLLFLTDLISRRQRESPAQPVDFEVLEQHALLWVLEVVEAAAAEGCVEAFACTSAGQKSQMAGRRQFEEFLNKKKQKHSRPSAPGAPRPNDGSPGS